MRKQRETPGVTPEMLGKWLDIDPAGIKCSGGQFVHFRAGWAKAIFNNSKKVHWFRRRTDNIGEALSLCGVKAGVHSLYGPGNWSQCSRCLQKVQKGFHL